MEIVFFLKPIVDMLYQLQWLDIVLVLLCIFFYVRNDNTFTLSALDIILLTLGVLWGFSFLRNTDGLADWIKIETAVFAYFVGRRLYQCHYSCLKHLKIGFLIVILVTSITYVTGSGFQMWGDINTFSGMYFFKTDLAAAMAQALIFFTLVSNPDNCKTNKLIVIILALLCSFFIAVSNARIYYFIILLLITYSIANYRELRGAKRLKIGFRFLFVLLLLIAGVLIALNSLQETVLGDEYLLVQFDEAEDLMNESNTQGRSIAWGLIIDYFFDQDLFSQTFGVDLVTDGIVGVICESHNVYLKVLFSIGYIGVLVFILFLVFAFKTIKCVQDTRLYYTTLGLFSMFLISGISYSSIISTQLTFLPMMYLGMSQSSIDNITTKQDYVA